MAYLLERGDPLKCLGELCGQHVVVFVLHSKPFLKQFNKLLPGDLVEPVDDGSSSRPEGLFHTPLFQGAVEVADCRAKAGLRYDRPASCCSGRGDAGGDSDPGRPGRDCYRGGTNAYTRCLGGYRAPGGPDGRCNLPHALGGPSPD